MNLSSRIFWLLFSSLIVLSGSATGLARDTPGYNKKIPDDILTPDAVETRIGMLKFFDGQPDAGTVQMVYDNLDFLRGVETFLNGMPAPAEERDPGRKLDISKSGTR